MKKYISNDNWKEQAELKKKECFDLISGTAKNFVRNPDLIAEALAFGSRFYEYSLRNNQLIFSQNPNALYVQSFPAWKKMGCSVKRGEVGMKILVPVKTTFLKLDDNSLVKLSEATKQQEYDYINGNIETITKTSFKVGTVFDIAQTTFPPEDYPELFSIGYPSELHDDVCKGIMDFSKLYYGCKVQYKDLSAVTLRGYYNRMDNDITINNTLKGTQKLSTLTHELGHAIMHNADCDKSRNIIEIEADALSIMLQSGLGLEILDSRKSHLASQFERLRRTTELEYGENAEDVCNEYLNNILESVHNVYANIRPNLDECISKYASRDRVKELSKDNSLEKPIEYSEQLNMVLSKEYELEL